MSIVVGIDPGLTGAIAVVHDDICHGVWDMPVVEKTHGKGKQINPRLLVDVMDEIVDVMHSDRLAVVIEQVASRPGQSSVATFSFGHSAGICEAVSAALGFRYTYVTPQRWKRLYGLTGRDKDCSRTEAIRLYPEMADQLARKKDHGRAEAMLIAGYGAQLRD